LFFCLFVFFVLFVFLSFYLFVSLSFCLFVCLSFCHFIILSFCHFIVLSFCLLSFVSTSLWTVDTCLNGVKSQKSLYVFNPIQVEVTQPVTKSGYRAARAAHKRIIFGQADQKRLHLDWEVLWTIIPFWTNPKDKGGSERDKDSSPNLSFNSLMQRKIEIEGGSARVSWYEMQLMIGQPNGVVQNYFFTNWFVSLLFTQQSPQVLGWEVGW
jgi:hypothetical protein